MMYEWSRRAEVKPSGFYTLFIEDDIEPYIHGPFQTDESRDKRSRELKREQGDKHGIFWMDITNGKIHLGSYTNQFFEDDQTG